MADFSPDFSADFDTVQVDLTKVDREVALFAAGPEGT